MIYKKDTHTHKNKKSNAKILTAEKVNRLYHQGNLSVCTQCHVGVKQLTVTIPSSILVACLQSLKKIHIYSAFILQREKKQH